MSALRLHSSTLSYALPILYGLICATVASAQSQQTSPVPQPWYATSDTTSDANPNNPQAQGSNPVPIAGNPMRPQSSDSTSQSFDASNGLNAGSSALPSTYSRNANPGAGMPLSATQIFRVLQEYPDSIVELKSFMSELAQQAGVSLQPDSISDEMVYSKVSSSAELRADITPFLMARGFISNLDLEADATIGDDAEPSALPRSATPSDQSATTQRPLLPSRGMDSLSTNLDIRNSMQYDEKTFPTWADEPTALHRPTPYNLLALRDLYTQLPEPTAVVKRFGSEVFTGRNLRGTNAASPDRLVSNRGETPLDVPAGPSYIVGPGDTLAIELWGGISQSLTRVVDREGRVALPESGSIAVAGLTLEQTQSVFFATLKQQFRNVQVAVTISRLRSIRVYVVGDVQRPGAYDISSLSSSLQALYAAGGPTSAGSLRTLRHFRGKQVVGEIDLYDFLLHGVRREDRLVAGDTLLVPPAGPQITVYGAVKRPAIYELKSADNNSGTPAPAMLAEVLDEAGGVTVEAELTHVAVNRIDANGQRETITLELPHSNDAAQAKTASASFPLRDGDRVYVSSILPYSQHVVYLQGHVARPGRTPFRDGMRLNDLLQSYRDLLPEPADQGEIVRLTPPDLHPETIDFSVPEALIGNENPSLQPLDTILIHGRYQFDAPRVTIGGEVLRPGTFALSSGMTAAQLVRMAGGFKRDASIDAADLTSYRVSNGTRVVSERATIRIGDAVLHDDRAADVVLKPGDVLTVHQITGWNDIGSSITIEGEVAHPGSYGIQPGEHLSSILRRAGGLRDTAYPSGAVLLRNEVRVLEEKSRQELIRQIESSSAAARVGTNLATNDQTATLQLIAQQQNEVLSKLKSQPSSGRLVIQIGGDISGWENTPNDIEVRAGDVLRIPKRPGFVLVSGQVYNASAITFSPDKTAEWYLRRAGGYTQLANSHEIFVIRANGTVVGRRSDAHFGHDVLSTRLDPGDVVVVPQKIVGASMFWRNLLTVGQIASSTAITAAVAGLL